MYLNRLVIRNFRNFRLLDAALERTITTIAGENNTGKSNLIFAIRLAVDATLSSYTRQLTREDFSSGLDLSTPRQILISLEFTEFAQSENQEAMLFGCHIADDTARITYRFRPKRDIREALAEGQKLKLTIDDYRWEIWGGGGDTDPVTVSWDEDFGRWVRFEELQQAYLVVMLEPLRDVEQRLRQSRRSPLARLLTPDDIPEKEQLALVSILETANEDIAKSKTLSAVGEGITKTFEETAGAAFSLSVKIGMSPTSFSDISRALTLLLSNAAMSDFSPQQNGLGLNNILYICMILQYFQRRVDEGKTAGQLLLLEEPEAHIHPQLQRVLYRSLQQMGFQAILTTHSTHISSQAPLSSLVLLTNDGTSATRSLCPTRQVSLSPTEERDLERYLDATRGTLLFARKVMLVEGPAELFLIPELARHVLNIDLDAEGISVVPIYGVHFDVYAKLFGPGLLPKRCAIVADGDQHPSDANLDAIKDIADFPFPEKQDLLSLKNPFVEVFLCASTFELELTHVGNLQMLSRAASDLGAPVVAEFLETSAQDLELLPGPNDKNSLLAEARSKVLNTAKRFGKARFAQTASKYADTAEWIPTYIKEAVLWLTSVSD